MIKSQYPHKAQFPNPDRVEDIKQIQEAMETCGGDSKEAAKLLGIRPVYLRKMIHKCDDLRLRWATSRTPTGPPDQDKLDESTEIIVQDDLVDVALRDEESGFKNGLMRIGVQGSALEMAVALQTFHGRYYTSNLKLIGGGLTKQFLDLMAEYQKLTAELDAGGREMPVINRETGNVEKRFIPMTPMREKILRDDRSRVAEQIQRVSDRANKAIYTQAVVKHRIEGRTKTAKPRGFLQINDPKVVNIAAMQQPPVLPESTEEGNGE